MTAQAHPALRYAIRVREWLSRDPDASLVVAGVLGVAAMIEVSVRGVLTDSDQTVDLIMGGLATLPVAYARTRVRAAAVTIVAACTASLWLSHALPVASALALVAVLYQTGLRSSRWAFVLLAPFVSYAFFGAQRGSQQVGGVILFGVTGVALGLGLQRRRVAAERAETERAMADTLAEHASRGERARIARELHDVVAHHISMISVQAEAARLGSPGMTEDGARRLTAIGDTARTALTEMRRVLGVLRADAGPGPALTPQPGLDQINELVDDARASGGASARLVLHGPVVAVDPGVALTAYRVVQEALTNARRHAPGAAVDVHLWYTVDTLRILVRDNGPGRAPTSIDGHGLRGMSERITMVGGRLSTSAGPTGGFVVEAVLPVSRAAAGQASA